MYTERTHTHTLMDLFKDRHEYGYFQCGNRMFYILLKLFFLTQYLSSVMSENKGILENSQLTVV